MLFGKGGAFGRGDSALPNFTEESRQALLRAREESAALHHDYVGTEHILLGLTNSLTLGGSQILRRLGVDVAELRRRIFLTCPAGKAKSAASEFPYTSRAKTVLELAMTEARERHAEAVEPIHLLMGVAREERGVGAVVLRDLGVTFGELAAMLSGDGSRRGASLVHIAIDDRSDRSIYEQIVSKVQEGVATGGLHPGDRLPTVRRLADELDIAPGTVARAYGELERLGIVVTEGARGTRIAPRERPAIPAAERPQTLTGLLRPVAVAAFHLGATAPELRTALESAMKDIFPHQNAA